MTQIRANVPRFDYKVIPVQEGRFAPYIITIPTASGEEFADRRAFWEAYQVLGRPGISEDEFIVNKWIDNQPGPRVGPGGTEVAE